jgi:hypothetical protein
MSDLGQVGHLQGRLQQALSLPGTLALSFDAFEAIRVLARQSQDRVPGLFAAFMTTADAAVDGREAVTIAPSLPPPGLSTAPSVGPAADTELDELIAALAQLAGLLADRLNRAAAGATLAADRAACEEAAAAAQQIRTLMARSDERPGLR